MNNNSFQCITEENCIDFIIYKCPNIKQQLTDIYVFFDGDEPGLYNKLTAFVDCIYDAVKDRDNDFLSCALECLEDLFVLGNTDVRGAASVGIIECVVNRCLNTKVDLKPFVEGLLSESKQAYTRLENFWNSPYPFPFDIESESDPNE